MSIRLPGVSHRTAIVGRTGSGKTRFGSWLLSMTPFDKQPYVIIDHKREGLFERIDRVKEIGYGEVPKHPGLYLLQPDSGDPALEEWMIKAFNRGKVGMYIDEGYEIPQRSFAFRKVLTQGRSQRVPVITLSQRPSGISRSVFTEADFFAFFQLSLEDDRKTAQSFAPKDRINLDDAFPRYHSRWYDVAEDKVSHLGPVPNDDEILDAIDRKLSPKRKVI